MPNDTTDRSIPDLVVQLTRQMSDLVRQEITLAQAEMRQNGANLVRNIVLLAVGGVITFAALLALLGTGVLALVEFAAMPAWAAGLTVGGGTLVVGVVLLIIGQVALSRANVGPTRTIRSIIHPGQEATK